MEPTNEPTYEPTAEPTNAPTDEVPTDAPTDEVPTNAPTDEVPTDAPTDEVPTNAPTDEVPTDAPTDEVPTNAPTDEVPTDAPTDEVPTNGPTDEVPTNEPTFEPTPTDEPTYAPTPTMTGGDDINKIIDKLGGYDDDKDKVDDNKNYMTKEEFHQKLVDHFTEENKYLEDVVAKAEAEYKSLSDKVKRMDDCIERAANKFGWYGVYEQAPHFENAVDWVANVCMKEEN